MSKIKEDIIKMFMECNIIISYHNDFLNELFFVISPKGLSIDIYSEEDKDKGTNYICGNLEEFAETIKITKDKLEIVTYFTARVYDGYIRNKQKHMVTLKKCLPAINKYFEKWNYEKWFFSKMFGFSLENTELHINYHLEFKEE